jgi:CRP-like cAMP-binding protein
MNESFDANNTPTPVDIPLSEIVSRLRASALTDDVTDADVAVFASFVTAVRYPDGAAICRRGAPASAMWCILSGAARVEVDGDPITHLGPDEIIGGRVLLDESPYGADVFAVGESVLLQATRENLSQAAWRDPNTLARLVRNVAEVQSSRIRASTRREVEAELGEQQARRLEKRYRRLFFGGLFAVGGVLLALLVTAEVTSQPKFCGSHHYIRPYYESWQTSTHKNVGCPDCHFPPGFKGYALRKYKALAEVAIYITGTYKGEPHAEVDDDGCLRSGCHIDRLVPGVKKYKNVTFDHRKHLPCGQHHLSANPEEFKNLPHAMPPSRAARTPPLGHEAFLETLPRGRILRCTSCHSNIVQGTHMTVTQSTCFLCHFKTAGETQPVSGCPSCHKAPDYKIMVNNVPFEHKPFVDKKVPCQQCHSSVTRGDGHVPRERCFQCHDRPERLVEFDDHKLIHEVHVTEHKKDCLVCHTEIQHGAQTVTDAMKSDCQRCHQSVQQVYLGQAAGLEMSPDPMFTARVRCDACHRSHENVSGGRESKLLKPNVCGQCHDSKFNGLVAQWTAGGQRLLADMETRLSRVENALESARAAGNLSRQTLWSATNLYRTAYTNVSTLRHGNPVHNIGFAQKLAAATNAQLVMAMNVLRGRGEAEPTLKLVSLNEPAGGRCLSCHFGIENVKNAVFGRVFEHGKHLLNAGLSCDRCHATTEPEQPGHGSLKIGSEGCMSCHHTTPSVTNCKACHDNLRVRQASLEKPFLHAPHALDYGLNCSTCHARNVQQTFTADCATCHHVAKVNVAAKCESCHATQFQLYRGLTPAGSPSLHTKAKVECDDCHVRKGDRMTTLPCSDCHKTGNYVGIRQSWQSKTREQLDTIRRLRRQLVGKTLDGATQRRVTAIDATSRRFAVDGSLSVHNPEVVDTTLSRDIDALQSYVWSR